MASGWILWWESLVTGVIKMKTGWVPLYGDGWPTKIVLSRPAECRPAIVESALPAFREDINKYAGTPQERMCFNMKCSATFSKLPDMVAFILAKPGTEQGIGMGICDDCAKMSDDAILEIMREQFIDMGIGPPRSNPNLVQRSFPVAHDETCDGVRIIITKNPPPGMALAFCFLLSHGLLHRFKAFHNGSRNCHYIVQMLKHDFEELGLAGEFKYKRGSSADLANDDDPKGLHTWIERDGWVLDGSNGSLGNPVLFQPTQDFYNSLSLKDIHDCDPNESLE